MHYSENLSWFEDVVWEEQDTVIDCLVDTSVTHIERGHYLVKEGEHCCVRLAEMIIEAKRDSTEGFLILGRVAMRCLPLIKLNI